MASITAPVLPMTIDKVSSLLSKVFGEITSDKVDFFLDMVNNNNYESFLVLGKS